MNELGYFLLALAINILLWWIKPAVVKRFFVKQGRKLLWYVYFVVAGVISLYLLFILVYIFPFVLKQVEPLNLIVLYVLTLLALVGIWMPALQHAQNKRLEKIVNITGACLLGVTFIFFWITQWPQWQTPALLTSLVALMFIVLLVDMLLAKRREKAVKKAKPSPASRLERGVTTKEPLSRTTSHDKADKQ